MFRKQAKKSFLVCHYSILSLLSHLILKKPFLNFSFRFFCLAFFSLSTFGLISPLLIYLILISFFLSISLSLSFFNVTKDLSFNFDHSDHKKIFVEITWFSFFLKSELVTNCKPEKKSQIRLKVRKVRGL